MRGTKESTWRAVIKKSKADSRTVGEKEMDQKDAQGPAGELGSPRFKVWRQPSAEILVLHVRLWFKFRPRRDKLEDHVQGVLDRAARVMGRCHISSC